MPITGLLIAASAAINLINGREQRELQESLHGQDRADAHLRSDRAFALQERQQLLQEQQVEALAIRHRDDAERRISEIDEHRSAVSLAEVIYPSTKGWYLHDPYGDDNPGIKALRILFQRQRGMSYVEQAINDAVLMYGQQGAGRPLHFLKGIWKESAPPASWVAGELHSWNRTIPTLILRLEHIDGQELLLEADIFGFPMAGSSFKHGLPLGRIPNDRRSIAHALQLVTLAIADMHLFATYAKMPILPFILPKLIQPGDDSGPVTNSLVAAYRQTMNAVIVAQPTIALYAALQLAEAFTALPDQSHAIAQIGEIEAMTRTILPTDSALTGRLRQLYAHAGAIDEAARLEQNLKDQGTPAVRRHLTLDEIT